MLQIFSFLPPVAFYGLAGMVVAGTLSVQSMLESAGQPADSRVYVVGGIMTFLFLFVGYQRSVEKREEASKPRVSSDEVLQKLSVKESGLADPGLDVPPENPSGPAADSPLGRVRARSQSLEA